MDTAYLDMIDRASNAEPDPSQYGDDEGYDSGGVPGKSKKGGPKKTVKAKGGLGPVKKLPDKAYTKPTNSSGLKKKGKK